jgi:hypothetical protein
VATAIAAALGQRVTPPMRMKSGIARSHAFFLLRLLEIAVGEKISPIWIGFLSYSPRPPGRIDAEAVAVLRILIGAEL